MSGAKLDEAKRALAATMKKWDNFGACDSEGYHAYSRVVEAGKNGHTYPLRGSNPWELYESIAGWEQAAAELDEGARKLWRALLEVTLSIEIKEP